MIKSLKVHNFMGHSHFDSGDFAPVNVFIGKNDTGKTGLIKLLYAVSKSIDIYSRRKQNEDVSLKKILAEKMTDTFQPGKKGLGELVLKGAKEKLEVDVRFRQVKLNFEDRLHFSFGENTTNTISGQDSINLISDQFRCLFIPAKEVLTPLKAIRATRDNLFMPGFDDTYLDLIKALVIPTQKGNIIQELVQVNKKLETLFEGKIEQGAETDEFIYKKGKSEFPLTITSEGVKKIGILATLIRNLQLNSTSVLFMDEPETMLHPAAIRELVEMLLLMAKAGIQVFLATHNYFVLKQIHLCAKKEHVLSNCYSFTRNPGGAINSQLFDLMDEFPENQIADEAIRMADEEVLLDLGL